MKLLPAEICRAFTWQLSLLVILVCASWGSSQLYVKQERNTGKPGISSSSQDLSWSELCLVATLSRVPAELCCRAPVWESSMPFHYREKRVHSTSAQTHKHRDIPKDRGPPLKPEVALGHSLDSCPRKCWRWGRYTSPCSWKAPVRPTTSKTCPEVSPMSIFLVIWTLIWTLLLL